MKNRFLFGTLFASIVYRPSDKGLNPLIFHNSVDSIKTLLVAMLRVVRRYKRTLVLIGIVALACCYSGCSLNRVALRTRYNDIPLELEFDYASGNNGNPASHASRTLNWE